LSAATRKREGVGSEFEIYITAHFYLIFFFV